MDISNNVIIQWLRITVSTTSIWTTYPCAVTNQHTKIVYMSNYYGTSIEEVIARTVATDHYSKTGFYSKSASGSPGCDFIIIGY